MASVSVYVAPEVLSQAKDRAAMQGYSSVEAYLQSLLLDDLGRLDDAALKELLLERVRSNEWVTMDAADFAALKANAEATIRKTQLRK